MSRFSLVLLLGVAACQPPMPEGVTDAGDGVRVQGWNGSEIVVSRAVWGRLLDSLRAHSERSGVPLSLYWAEVYPTQDVPPPAPLPADSAEAWKEALAEYQRQLASAPTYPVVMFANSSADRVLLEEARRREIEEGGDTLTVTVPVGYGKLYFRLAPDTSEVVRVEVYQ